MARYQFITSIELTKVRVKDGLWGSGVDVVKEVEYNDKTINVPSESDIRKFVAEETVRITHDIALQSRKLTKTAEQAAVAAKDATEARETVERMVETARETFRDVIEELLAPHYRRLAALAAAAGIEVPEETTEQKKPAKEQSAVARNTPPPASGGSPLSEGAKKKGRASGKSPFSRTKKSTVAKKTAASSRTKSKGARPCRKK
jgi:predicted CopG family antitoxin